jgi:hypothetical protein
VHATGPGLDDERDIQALERDRAVDVEEVGRQQCGGVGAQESASGFVAVHWRRDAVSAQDLADGGGRDPVPEPSQLTLDAYHSPARFSRASRRISVVSSSGIGGRPGGLGWRHFAAAMRRCQRSSVPGVAIRRARSAFGRTRASAASGLSRPGSSVATTIAFFEVSIPRWISPACDATLDMTAGSLPP